MFGVSLHFETDVLSLYRNGTLDCQDYCLCLKNFSDSMLVSLSPSRYTRTGLCIRRASQGIDLESGHMIK